MKRAVIICLITIWAVAALGAVGFIIISWSGQGNNMLNFEAGFNTVPLKEESVPSSGVKNLEVSVSFESVEVEATDGDSFQAVQYGLANSPENVLFKVEKSGDKLRIFIDRQSFRIGLFIPFNDRKLVVKIPRAWSGSLSLGASSGSVRILDEFSLEDVSINTASGSVRLEKPLRAAGLDIKSSSGSVRLLDDITVSEEFVSRSSSGSQTAEGRLTAQSARFETSSGSIRVRNNISCDGSIDINSTSGGIDIEGEVSGKTLTAGSTSGSISFETVLAESFSVKCASGGIRIGGISGSGELKSTSGSVSAGLTDPVGNVSAKCSSGTVRLSVPKELSFEFEGNTVSGGIRTDFEVLYRDGRRKSAVASVGEDPAVRLEAETTSGGINVEFR